MRLKGDGCSICSASPPSTFAGSASFVTASIGGPKLLIAALSMRIDHLRETSHPPPAATVAS